jgi:hypothetical protein
MLRTTTGRIIATLLVSLAIHLLLLFVPWVELPQPEEPELPPLTARLVPLPKQAVVPPVPKPAAKALAAPRAKPVRAKPIAHEPSDVLAFADAVSAVEPVSGVEAASAVEPASSVVEASAIEPAPTPDASEPTPPSHPTLPKHAQLRFIVYKGTDFQVGEAKHRFEMTEDKHYTIKVGMSTTGIVSLFKIYDSEQISMGLVDGQGLRPESFTENKRTGKGKESFGVQFNWTDKQLNFSSGNQVALPEHTQDLLSALYQVSQLDLQKGKISVPVTNGRKLERYEFSVGEEQALPSRLGTLRALPLRKIHGVGEEGLEIWLGLEYRLLPIKFTQIDRAGHVAAEMVIAEIRVAE